MKTNLTENLVLSRFLHHGKHGTFGMMNVNGRTIYTVERPWRDNKPYKSCIPPGKYVCKKRKTTTSVPSSMQGRTWYLEGKSVTVHPEDKDGTKTRCLVCIHIGNYTSDIQGCLSPGLSMGMIDERLMVQHSRKAMMHLNEYLPDQFTLEIIHPNPYENYSL